MEELALVSDLPGYYKADVKELSEMIKMLPHDSAADAIDRIWHRMGYGSYAKNNRLDLGKYEILRMLAVNESSGMAFLRRLAQLKEIIQTHQNNSENRLTLSTKKQYRCVTCDFLPSSY